MTFGRLWKNVRLERMLRLTNWCFLDLRSKSCLWKNQKIYWFFPSSSLEQSIRDDVDFVKTSDLVRKELADRTRGYVHDLQTGKLTPIVWRMSEEWVGSVVLWKDVYWLLFCYHYPMNMTIDRFIIWTYFISRAICLLCLHPDTFYVPRSHCFKH